MNEYIEIGVINTLEIDRVTDHGLYLVSKSGEDVLLPNQYVTDDMKPASLIDVFIYTDSEDRIIATTLRPKAMLDEFAYMEVVDETGFGVFVDWGLPKNLLVPKGLQKIPLQIGMKSLFRVCLDEKSDRLIASHKFSNYLSDDLSALHVNKKVTAIPYKKTPLGYKVIVDNLYEGMLYHNEIFQKIALGEKLEAYVKKIRDDKKLDISLQPTGSGNFDIAKEKVLEVLKKNSGFLPLNYKSSPDDVKEIFGLSKKSYKKALTLLLEESKISLDERGMKLN